MKRLNIFFHSKIISTIQHEYYFTLFSNCHFYTFQKLHELVDAKIIVS